MAQKNKKKRGFSLAETAVALAVIAIVSGAAMSMVLSSADIEGGTMLTSYVINDAENVVDCFRYAGTATEFYTVLEKANPDRQWKKISDNREDTEPGKRVIKYELEQDNYTVTLTLTLVNTADADDLKLEDKDTLHFSAVNRRGDLVMSEVTFTKKGGS